MENLRVVLVATRNPLNMGAAARAMSNFGALHLRVVTSASDERAGLFAALKRSFAALIPFGFMVALFNPERRTLSDYLAGTRVIRWVMET